MVAKVNGKCTGRQGSPRLLNPVHKGGAMTNSTTESSVRLDIFIEAWLEQNIIPGKTGFWAGYYIGEDEEKLKRLSYHTLACGLTESLLQGGYCRYVGV